ncbi:MAG: GerA spore germination protein [Bacillales bacterium]|jgi:spore germination protein KA|nr:GerA spore germination protein [Bacillales bacterium]
MEKVQNDQLDSNIEKNIKTLKDTFSESQDYVSREICLGNGKYKILISFFDGLADTKYINDFIIESIIRHDKQILLGFLEKGPSEVLNIIYNTAISSSSISKTTSIKEINLNLVEGNTVLVFQETNEAFIIPTPGWKDRGVGETTVNNVIRGPRESFTETIRTNTALIRRRIKDENLCCEEIRIGNNTKTIVALMYLKGTANENILSILKERINKINIKGIMETGNIEEFIGEEKYSPFPTVFNTERPDTVTANILEGKIAILVDGTPFALTVPALFSEFFTSADDYYNKWDISTLIRILRYFAFFIALLGPSVYIALTTFHAEMIPTQLLMSLAAQREGIPFPAFVEALIMEATFEVIREAGLRMPKPLGQAISIVGALVIGQSAVEAGFVSAAMVIVVAITALSSIVFPSYNMAIPVRMLRFLMMSLAASFGLFGIAVGLLTLLVHLTSLKSFGIYYMIPYAPNNKYLLRDTVIRAPYNAFNKQIKEEMGNLNYKPIVLNTVSKGSKDND